MARAGQAVKSASADMEKSFRMSEGAAADLKQELAGLFTLGALGAFVKSSRDAVLQAEASFRGLEAVANYTGVGIGRAFQEAKRLSADGLISMADASKALQNLLSRGYNLEQAVQVLERLKDAAVYNRAAHLSMSEAVLTATEGLKQENSVLVDNAGVTKNVAKMWEEYAAQLGKSANDLTQAEKIQAEYNGILRETEAQVGNAQKALTGLQGEEAKLQKATTDLKVAVGTGLTPAMTALASTGATLMEKWVKPFLGGIEIMAIKLAALGNMVSTVANHQYKATTAWGRMKEQAQAWKQAYDDSFTLADEMALEVVAKYTGGLSPGALQLEAGGGAGTTGSGPTRARGGGAAGGASKPARARAPSSRMPDWQLELEQQQSARPDFSADLAAERDFWQQKLTIARAGNGERRQVEMELLRVNRAIRQADFQDELAALQDKRNATAAASIERIQAAGAIAARLRAVYGEDSKEYRAALADMDRAAQERQQQLNTLAGMEIERNRQHNLALLEMDRQALQLRDQLGDIGAEQRLAKLQEFHDRELAIEQAALQQKLSLISETDLIGRQQILDQQASMEEQHRQQSQQLQGQAALESKAQWESIFSGVTGAVDTSIQGLILGTTTWRQAFANLGQSVLAEFTGMTVRLAARWAATELAKTGATATGTAARTGLETAAAIKSVGIWAWSALKNIATSAWEAAAGAYKAIAGIPYVGPFLAPAMAVGASATVLGFGAKIASAAGGWEVPADQLAMVHEDEMILPKHLSDRIRAITEPNQGGSTFHISIQAVDAHSVERLFNDHGGALVQALRAQARDFSFGGVD